MANLYRISKSFSENLLLKNVEYVALDEPPVTVVNDPRVLNAKFSVSRSQETRFPAIIVSQTQGSATLWNEQTDPIRAWCQNVQPSPLMFELNISLQPDGTMEVKDKINGVWDTHSLFWCCSCFLEKLLKHTCAHKNCNFTLFFVKCFMLMCCIFCRVMGFRQYAGLCHKSTAG